MRLLDLLVQELPRRGGWPEDVTHIGQDYDRELMFYGRGRAMTGIFLDELAIDHRKCGRNGAKINKEQYEAALAASKCVVGHDGWIQWAGGDCPVDSDAIVEVKFRNPSRNKFNNDRAGDFDWSHDGFGGDIIAYRLQHPGFKSRSKDERLEQDLNECIGQDFDVVNHPSHYTKGRIECIDAIDSATTGKSGIEAVCVANIIKYLYRYEEKNGLEDVKKAKWYINKLISELESK